MQRKKQQKISYRSQCPISSALDIVGDKWSLLIVRDILFSSKRTFGEFAGSEEKIATNILTDRLNRLTQVGILAKKRAPGNDKTFIYSLTEKGADLLPIIVEYILWSDRYLHDHISDSAKQFASLLRKKKLFMIKQTIKKLS